MKNKRDMGNNISRLEIVAEEATLKTYIWSSAAWNWHHQSTYDL
ncbi:hypothetical protein [Ruminiclostridium herbifermentans]|nr:hypothetical protein [Ruminiclostridium herbifermentans]